MGDAYRQCGEMSPLSTVCGRCLQEVCRNVTCVCSVGEMPAGSVSECQLGLQCVRFERGNTVKNTAILSLGYNFAQTIQNEPLGCASGRREKGPLFLVLLFSNKILPRADSRV